jgi:hypothetical protein
VQDTEKMSADTARILKIDKNPRGITSSHFGHDVGMAVLGSFAHAVYVYPIRLPSLYRLTSDVPLTGILR